MVHFQCTKLIVVSITFRRFHFSYGKRLEKRILYLLFVDLFEKRKKVNA